MTEGDPYAALGVTHIAAAAEIKSAYRKRARALHPDVNRSDPEAEEKFKELVAAYELLCDPLRRSAYDRDRGRFGPKGSWDFRSAPASYTRQETRTRSASPQVWTTVQAVPLRERIGLTRRGRAHAPLLHRVLVSPDLRRVATHRGDAVHLWDARTGRSVAHVGNAGERVGRLEFSPDGRWLMTEGVRGTVLWDATSGREVDRLNLDGPGNVSFSSDGERMATAVHTIAHVSDVGSGRELAEVLHEAPLGGIALSSDGQALATAVHTSARVWDVHSGRQLAEMSHEKPVVSMELSPDGGLLATSTTLPRSSWTPTAVQLWDVEGGRELARLQHGCWVDRVLFSPDGRRLATDSNGTLQLWDLSSGPQPVWISSLFVSSDLAFSPDGRWLATASRWNVQVWDLETGSEVASLNHAAEVLSLAISPDGQRIGTGSVDRSAQGHRSPAPVTAHVWLRAEALAAGSSTGRRR